MEGRSSLRLGDQNSNSLRTRLDFLTNLPDSSLAKQVFFELNECNRLLTPIILCSLACEQRGSKIMLRMRAALSFALVSCTLGGLNAQQSTAPLSKVHQQIIVKIRNAKTGRPLWIASPYVFLGSPDPQKVEKSYRRTKFWGDAHVDVSATQPREVRVWVDFIERDCRYGDDFKRFLSSIMLAILSEIRRRTI